MRCSAVFFRVCFSVVFRESLSEAFLVFFLVVVLAYLVLFFVFFVVAFLTAYYIKHNAPWINQLDKGSSPVLINQHDDFSPPGWPHCVRLISIA